MKNKDCTIQPFNRVTAICNNSHNEILFLRNREPANKNTLILPGDFIRCGELAEEALRRSILQLTTLCVEPIDILGIYSHIDNAKGVHIIESVFVCIITNYLELDMKLGSDRCVWMNPEQVEETKKSIYNNKIVTDYYSWRIQKSTFWTTKI
ncbi:MAG: NUDIX domain-containing protein [Candidatus Nitrosocosmicus sp.]|nr:NUDIX domain-containing protein [Candidatus Nitrosocosmicus sp.]MDN5866484.1 NUDIX domain-containing protein [Candidatus Nitrosocosmicus sp.]